MNVEDVTSDQQDYVQNQVLGNQGNRKVNAVYSLSLLQNGNPVMEDFTYTIQIPVTSDLMNASILVQTKDGNFKAIQPKIIDGFYVFETDYLGLVSILNETSEHVNPDDQDNQPPTDGNKPSLLPSDDTGGSTNSPQTSVKGNYVTAGGETGDTHTLSVYLFTLVVSITSIFFLYKRRDL